VTVLDQEYSAKLVDMACITESWKSNDLMTYYKSGDVSQMLIVTEGKQTIPNEWESGFTAPMRNVLKHWIKEKVNVSVDDINLMIDEVQKLIREEKDPNVKFEVISEGEDTEDDDRSRSQTQDASDERSLSPMSNSGESEVSDSDIASSPRSQMSGEEDQDSRSQSDEEDIEELLNQKVRIDEECQKLNQQLLSKTYDMNSTTNVILQDRFRKEVDELTQKLKATQMIANDLKNKLDNFL
jgi:TATA-binding protein-associated factor Taf7